MKSTHLLFAVVICGLVIGCAHNQIKPTNSNASKPDNGTAVAVAESQNATFAVVAPTNAQPLFYQWQFTDANTPRSGSLTAEQAKSLAMKLANERALALYDCQPFREGQPARFVADHWLWDALQGYGLGDIHATVELAADGSTNKVVVHLLDNRNLLLLKRQF
jgi:hypothetical protein